MRVGHETKTPTARDGEPGSRRCHYSIVVPVYCNAGGLLSLFESLTVEVLRANPGRSAEILFVDDGSEDGSLDELKRIQRESPFSVTIIKLTRNFGQAAALLAGYRHARGDCVVTISADGQEPPSLVNDMLRAFFEEGYEIVICARAGRDESFYRIMTSRLYFSLLRKLTFQHMPKGGFDVWLLSRRALEVFLRNSDAHTSFQWRVLWMGFKAKRIEYRRLARVAGVSRFTFAKKLEAVLAGVLGSSIVPTRMLWLIGSASSLIGVVWGCYGLIDRLLFAHPTPAWVPVSVLLLIVGGCQMAILGILAEYVWRILSHLRTQDEYVIDSIDRGLAE